MRLNKNYFEANKLKRRLSRVKKVSPKNFFMNQNPRYKYYKIGDWTYGNPKIYPVIPSGKVKLSVGSFCSFADGVKILLDVEHRPDWVTTYPFNILFDEGKSIPGHPNAKGDVSIGNDVWVGMDALILSGVKIGDGAIIGAKSLVIKDVEPYSIVGGVPAKVIRYRFDKEMIDELLKLSWWTWPLKKIEEHLPKLLSGDIESLLNEND